MKTQEEINNEVERLKSIKQKVKPFSIFGDDNHAKIDAVIHMLESGWSARDEAVRSDADFLSELEEAQAWRNGEKVEFSPAEAWE